MEIEKLEQAMSIMRDIDHLESVLYTLENFCNVEGDLSILHNNVINSVKEMIKYKRAVIKNI